MKYSIQETFIQRRQKIFGLLSMNVCIAFKTKALRTIELIASLCALRFLTEDVFRRKKAFRKKFFEQK